MTVGNLLIKLGLRGAKAVQRGANKAVKSLEKVADTQEEVSNASSQAASSLSRVSDAQEQVRSTSGSATNIVTSFGDAIQDARFGIAGAANNLSFIAESFAETARTAGSASAALRLVGSALLGPAGIILALQTLLAFLPEIQEALQGASVSSGDLTAEFAALGATLFPIRDEIKQLATAIKTALIGAFKGVGGPIKNALGNVVTVVTAAFKVIGQATELFLNILTGDFSGAWGNVVTIIKTALQAVVRIIGRGIDTTLSILQGFTEGVDSLFGTALSRGADEARASVQGFFNGLTSDLADTEQEVVDTASTIGQALAQIGSSDSSEGSSKDDSSIPDRPRIQAQQATDEIVSQADQPFAGMGAQVRKTGELIDKAYTRAVIRANAVTLGFKRQGSRAIRQVGQAVGQTIGKILTLQTAVSGVGDAFKQIGKSILQVLQKVIAKLVSAVATAGILAAVSGGGFGSLFGSVLGVPGLGGGGGGGGVGAVSGASSLQGVGVTETRLDGRDLALSVTKTQNAQRRKGRTSR